MDNRVSNYRKTITSMFNYIDYMNEDVNIVSEESLKYMQVLFSMLLLQYNEKYIINKNNMTSLLSDDVVDFCLSIISKKNKNKYILGEIEGTKEEIIHILRNKLSHFEFEFKNDIITIEYNDKKANIRLNDLCKFSITVNNVVKKCSGGQTDRIIAVFKRNFNNINTFEEFKKYVLFINIKTDVIKPYKKNLLYYGGKDYIDYYLENIHSVSRTNEQYIKYLENLKKELAKTNIEMNYDQIKTIDKKKINNILREYNVEYGMDDNSGKYYYLAHEICKTIRRNDERNILEGIFLCMLINIDIMKNNMYNNYLIDVLSANKNLLNGFTFNRKEMFSMLYFIAFNAIFSNGLENVFGDKDTIDEIVNSNTIDYSSFDLDDLIDERITKDINTASFKNEIMKVYRKQKKIEKKIDKYNNAYENSCDEKFKKLLEKEIENLIIIKSESKYKDEFYLEKARKYVLNKRIIRHIRNSIAHGNYEIDRYNKDCSFHNTLITFKDYDDNGKLTFIKSITLNDFIMLINRNCSKVCDFVDDKEFEKNISCKINK